MIDHRSRVEREEPCIYKASGCLARPVPNSSIEVLENGVFTNFNFESPPSARKIPYRLEHDRNPGEALGPTTRSLPPSAQDVNPPNPSKIAKPPVNTGDLYFQNLAYLPPPASYNGSRPHRNIDPHRIPRQYGLP